MTTAFLVVLGFLPGFVWLIFYLHEDLHPEPKKLIALTFFFGMIASFVALFAERILNGYLSPKILELAVPLSLSQLFYLVALAGIEETVKFGAAYASVHKDTDFNEPVDPMIYMVVAALGFATIENLGALSGAPNGQTGVLANALSTISVRFVGATLLHSLASGFVGYYWAMGIREFKTHTWKHILSGLALATILHSLFNYFIINYGNFIYLMAFLIIVGFFLISDFEEREQEAV